MIKLIPIRFSVFIVEKSNKEIAASFNSLLNVRRKISEHVYTGSFNLDFLHTT